MATERRGTAAQRGYGYKWQQASKGYLKSHPVCVYCERLGRVKASTLVDHVIPHKGDMVLFWDRNNWQALCKDCHDGAKAREERSGVVIGCDAQGLPLDPSHHWNRSDSHRGAPHGCVGANENASQQEGAGQKSGPNGF